MVKEENPCPTAEITTESNFFVGVAKEVEGGVLLKKCRESPKVCLTHSIHFSRVIVNFLDRRRKMNPEEHPDRRPSIFIASIEWEWTPRQEDEEIWSTDFELKG